MLDHLVASAVDGPLIGTPGRHADGQWAAVLTGFRQSFCQWKQRSFGGFGLRPILSGQNTEDNDRRNNETKAGFHSSAPFFGLMWTDYG
jgi:hypothetical protein